MPPGQGSIKRAQAHLLAAQTYRDTKASKRACFSTLNKRLNVKRWIKEIINQIIFKSADLTIFINMTDTTDCLFETIGHHVCENTGEEDVKKKAPFPATRDDKFLGDGYYFWEDNLQLAKDWGGKIYHNRNKPYVVCQFSISCKSNEFYDLVGNRGHQKHIVRIRKFLTQRRNALHGWPIGKIIDFLREANDSSDPDFEIFKGQFLYTMVRAVDNNYPFSSDQIKFNKEQISFTDLNPCYIICVVNIKKVVLGPIDIVHASKKA